MANYLRFINVLDMYYNFFIISMCSLSVYLHFCSLSLYLHFCSLSVSLSSFYSLSLYLHLFIIYLSMYVSRFVPYQFFSQFVYLSISFKLFIIYLPIYLNLFIISLFSIINLSIPICLLAMFRDNLLRWIYLSIFFVQSIYFNVHVSFFLYLFQYIYMNANSALSTTKSASCRAMFCKLASRARARPIQRCFIIVTTCQILLS